MPLPQTTLHTMTRNDLNLAVEWAAGEGWNPGQHDADAFFAADPEGFLLERLDGEPVAVISAVKYGERFGFIGFYIVKPAFRGRGLGLQIWNAAMERLAGRTIGLDGVVEQQHNYRKSGFALAWNNARYQGVGGGSAQIDAAIVPLASVSMDELLAYDRPFFPDDRCAFLQAWLAMPGVVALGILEADRLAGFGVLRACREGFKVGPMFADSPAQAARLLAALRTHVPQGEPLFLDVPLANPEAVALADQLGMKMVFETARMYTPAEPAMPLPRLYGVTSYELG